MTCSHSLSHLLTRARTCSSAQRQGIAVIAYTCKTGLDKAVMQRIKDELSTYPGVNASR